MAEDGHFYNFVPEEMGNDYMVTDLADGVSSFQALGSEGDSMSPWWLGLPLLALGAAGGGGGSGSANTLPDAPNLLMVEDNYDADDTSNWKYGAYDDTGSWVLDSTTGEWSVESGNVNIKDGKIITNDSTPSFIISDIESGSTIEVYDYDAVADTYTLVESTMVENTDGTWSVTVNEETASGDSNVLSDGEHTLFLIERNAADNALDPSNGTQIDIAVDTTSPIYVNKFNITDIDQGDGVRNSRDYYSNSAGDNYYFTNEFTVSDDLGYTYGAQGSPYPVFNSIPYEVGDRVYIEIYLLDEFGEISETYRIIDQNLSVEASAIVDSNGNWSVSIFNTDTTDGTPNAPTVYNTTTGQYVTLPDGEYAWRTLVVEPSGNLSAQSTMAGGHFAIDTTAPEANSIESFARNGDDIVLRGNINGYAPLSVTAGGENGDGVYNRDDDFLIGTTASKLYVSRSDDDGVSYHNVGEVNVEGSEWDFTDVTITEDGVYIYKVETLDVAGNASGSGDVFYAVVDADKNGIYSGVETDVVGTAGNDVFQTDIANLNFKLDGGEGIDTLIINPSSPSTLMLDSSKTANFEIYDLGASQTLIINGGVDGDTDHVIINGTGNIELDSSWSEGSTTSSDGVDYTIYTSASSADDLWIDTSNVSHVTIG